MLIPSVDLLKIMNRAKTGIWPELLVDGSVNLVVKLPQSVIKKIYRGVDCALITAIICVKQYRIFYIGFCVYDDLINPLVIVQPVVTEKELTEYQIIMGRQQVKLNMFDELCHPLLHASCNFDSNIATKVFKKIKDFETIALIPTSVNYNSILEWSLEVEQGMDIFQKDLDLLKKGMSSSSIPGTNHVIPLSLIIHEPINGYAINSEGDTVKFTLTQSNEGTIFEDLIFHSLNELYCGKSILRPLRKAKGKELADVIAFDNDEKIICLIQAKTIGGLTVLIHQSSKRRAQSIEKDVKDALKQLIGAIRYIRNGNQIFDHDNNAIMDIPNQVTSRIHAIVLISELYAFVDWKDIGKVIIDNSNDERYRALFHILDLVELKLLLTNSCSMQEFHTLLLQRWIEVRKSGTAYVKGQNKIR